MTYKLPSDNKISWMNNEILPIRISLEEAVFPLAVKIRQAYLHKARDIKLWGVQLSHLCLGLTLLRGQQPVCRHRISLQQHECSQSFLFKGSLSVTCFLFKDWCSSQGNCFHIKGFVGRLQRILVQGFLHSRNRDGQPCKAEPQAQDFSFNAEPAPESTRCQGLKKLISISFLSLEIR